MNFLLGIYHDCYFFIFQRFFIFSKFDLDTSKPTIKIRFRRFFYICESFYDIFFCFDQKLPISVDFIESASSISRITQEKIGIPNIYFKYFLKICFRCIYFSLEKVNEITLYGIQIIFINKWEYRIFYFFYC